MLAVLVAARLGDIFFGLWGWRADFVIGILIAACFAAPWLEVLPVAVWILWVISWRPYPGPESAVLIALCAAWCLLRSVMPWEWWLGTVVAGVISVSVFYFASASGLFFSNLGFILSDMFWVSLAGLSCGGLARLCFQTESPTGL